MTGSAHSHRARRFGTRKAVVGSGLLAACLVLLAMTWPARAERARETGFARACTTQPAGVSVPKGYRASSVTVGPLSLFSFGQIHANGKTSTAPASRFAAVRAGRYRVSRLWAVLPPGQWATVSVPPAELRVLSLAYDPALWSRGGWDGTARVAQGDARVTFRACPRKQAQGQPPLVVYDGGLIAAGARCAHLEVLARGWLKPRTVVVALGRRRC
jgi:hypothetical protein